MSRRDDLIRFYRLLDGLEQQLGGKRKLVDCSGVMDWPQRGAYFFFEPAEIRKDSGVGPRVVRVGTHALKEGSQTTLWKRLSQHKGVSRTGGGNHRGSVFRLIVGAALIKKFPDLALPSWGKGSTAPRDVRQNEDQLETEVSRTIGAMPILWLSLDDPPGSESLRGFIERNAIALLSNFEEIHLDPPSNTWLGSACPRTRVRRSGLWNSNHVNESYDPSFLNTLENTLVE